VKVTDREAASKENHPRMGEIGTSTHFGCAAGGQGTKNTPPRSCHGPRQGREAGVLQVLLGHRRLTVAKAVALADVLKHELERFTVKINIATGHESFEAWREKEHDDIVLAVALACWFAERGQRKFTFFA